MDIEDTLRKPRFLISASLGIARISYLSSETLLKGRLLEKKELDLGRDAELLLFSGISMVLLLCGTGPLYTQGSSGGGL